MLWNPEAERLLGWRADEVLGRAPPFASPALHASDDRHAKSRAKRARGALARLSVSVLTISPATECIDHRGDRRRIAGDRKRLEQQVVQGVKLEAVARLAGGIAHDFNNILAAIKCSCELIADSLAPDDARGADVRAIVHASARAAELTRQLLAFTRQQVLRAARWSTSTTSCARPSACCSGSPATRCRCRSSSRTAPSTCARIPRSSSRRSSISSSNAREATPPGGRATISTGLRSSTRDPTGGEVPIAPGSYGGSPCVTRAAGFRASYTAASSSPSSRRRSARTGTGLGLSAVFGIVKQSGGYTFVESEPGHGATFTIYLPLVAGTRVDRFPPAHAERTQPSHPATILLVEDEACAARADAADSRAQRLSRARGRARAQALEQCETARGRDRSRRLRHRDADDGRTRDGGSTARAAAAHASCSSCPASPTTR